MSSASPATAGARGGEVNALLTAHVRIACGTPTHPCSTVTRRTGSGTAALAIATGNCAVDALTLLVLPVLTARRGVLKRATSLMDVDGAGVALAETEAACDADALGRRLGGTGVADGVGGSPT